MQSYKISIDVFINAETEIGAETSLKNKLWLYVGDLTYCINKTELIKWSAKY